MTNLPTTPKPEHFPSPFAALLLTIGGVAIATFATVFMMVMTGSKPTVASLGIGEAIGLGAVASFAAQRVAAPHRERLGLRGFAPAYIPILLMLLPLAVVLSEMDNIVRSILPPIEIPPEMQELQDSLIGSRSFLGTIETMLVAVGIAPVVEEWLFRGVILQGLVARTSRLRGVIVTAGLFAVGHIGSTFSGPQLVSPLLASFALGLILGAVRLATGSVLAPIIVSASVSAVGLAALWLADAVPIPGFNAPGEHTPAAVLIPAVFAVCWACTLVVRDAQKSPAIPLPGEPGNDEEEPSPGS